MKATRILLRDQGNLYSRITVRDEYRLDMPSNTSAYTHRVSSGDKEPIPFPIWYAKLPGRRRQTMSWIADKTGKFRQLSNSYLSLHITSKFLFGVGLGVLLADWFPKWTG